MKSILNTVLPAMALLALGGCATTSALTTTEGDGVYYSSKDRTTYNAPARTTAAVQDAAPESTASDAETNPDYSASGKSSSSSQGSSSEYYDEDYGYAQRIRRFHQPAYRSFSYGYYDPFYSDPFWYGGSAYSYYGGGYSPYGWGPGYYGGYDPFYSPYYGSSAVIINIGFGRPYYNPWRYGYGGYGGYGMGYYDGYRNGLYNGYGYGYGSAYYGGSIGTVRNVNYGPRGTRSVEATTDGRNGTVSSGVGRGRSTREGGVAAPVGGTNTTGNATAPAWNGRGRTQAAGGSTDAVATPADVRSGRGREGSEQVLRKSAVFEDERGAQINSRSREGAEQPRTTESGGRRWRVVENTGDAGSQPAATPAPTYSEQRRSRVREYSNEQNNGQNGGGQVTEQPVRRQRTYETPQQPQQRTYEAPQRTYEAPQQRSYEAPSRSAEPSRSSAPSSGGGGRSGGRGRE
ncbi:YgdI/YgdR family lipoprotein [Hymenobacter lucidus]|uniref:YgdI/YgdR family lipoprotein n=1 Tax=Hymenobacter lucidus TaxID=2880930 RepID=A0ABS8ASJ4_9BACT|nr:YgdI/YgdR family lipoprotein [Hymenobacter lucidus]MCB2409182.1 YgdI/YgdR family lipoprotein [Hymenobacter lucidus]